MLIFGALQGLNSKMKQYLMIIEYTTSFPACIVQYINVELGLGSSSKEQGST